MAVKSRLSATVTVKESIKLSPKAKTMLLARAEEHAKLAKIVKDSQARQKRIRKEAEDIFVKEKQGRALTEGVDLEGVKFKLVCGTSKKLDRQKLIELGCDPEWIDEATDEKPNEPYVKITAAGEKEDA